MQAHADVEPVDEDGGNVAAVVFVGGFFFDDAGHGQQFVGGFVRQAALAFFPGLIEVFLHGAVGEFVELQIAAAGVKFVAVGGKQAFRAGVPCFGIDFFQQFFVAPACGVVFQIGGLVDDTAHLGKAHTFDDLYGYGVGLCFFQFLQNLPGRNFLRQFVAAALQAVVYAEHVGRTDQHVAAVNDVVFGQTVADGGNALAVFDFDAVGLRVSFR